MAKSTLMDEFTAKVVVSITQDTANTLKYTKIETGVSIYDSVGWVLVRADYRLGTATVGHFNGTSDRLTCALVSSSIPTAISDDDPALYDLQTWQRSDFGTAASGFLHDMLASHDFSTMPGGGLLMLPNPLYVAIESSGLADVAQCIITVYFKQVQLSPPDYTNLIQARQLLIST